MRTVLVHPSGFNVYERIDRTSVKLDKKQGKTEPIGISYIAAVLQENNYAVKILDAEALNLGVNETAGWLIKESPDIVGITVTTPLIDTSITLAKEVKKRNSDIKVVLGGSHISALPEESLAYKPVDFVVRNEGDYSFLELVRALEKGTDLSSVKGIGYKSNNKLVLNPRRERIENLDQIPFPARNLLPNEKYLNMYYGDQFTTMITGRGCPFQCIFCSSAITFGHRVRFRSPGNVIAELKEIVYKFRRRRITFADDTFTLNKRRTIDICKGIIDNSLDISFTCSSRVDTIDEERLVYLKKAGCRHITYGVESGDNNILKTIKKGTTVEQARNAIRLTKKYDIETHASYMLGNPGETIETINRTVEFANELDTDFTQFTIAVPLPGSEMWDMANKEALLGRGGFSEFHFYYPSITMVEGLTAEQLNEIQRQAYKNYRGGRQGRRTRGSSDDRSL